MKTRTCRKQNKDSNKFGKRGTFGFPIDISCFESLKFGTTLWYDSNGRKINSNNNVLSAIFKMCEAQGNPRSLLIEEEEAEINAQIKQEFATWLLEAIERLPKNEGACVSLRYWLDRSEPKPKNKKGIRTQAEVGEIVGVSQQTADRNIKRGLKNLKKDFKKNLQGKISKLKS